MREVLTHVKFSMPPGPCFFLFLFLKSGMTEAFFKAVSGTFMKVTVFTNQTWVEWTDMISTNHRVISGYFACSRYVGVHASVTSNLVALLEKTRVFAMR